MKAADIKLLQTQGSNIPTGKYFKLGEIRDVVFLLLNQYHRMHFTTDKIYTNSNPEDKFVPTILTT